MNLTNTNNTQIAGIVLLVALGIIVFKWRKRQNASVYDRPPPPGIHDGDDKRGSGAPVIHVEQLGDKVRYGPARGSVDRRVSSWIRGTASRFSLKVLAAPAPVFAGPRSNAGTESEVK